jgi:long-chain acyl-CoA synthetase
MTDMPNSASTHQPRLQAELFRPQLIYPTHPYDEILSNTARRYPENTAIVFRDVSLTYREYDVLVNAFANALLDLGIRKGDNVCLLMTNRPEFLISWFAIIRIGAAASPMNPSYKEREIAYQLSNSESVAIIVQQELLPLVEAVRSEAPNLKYIITVGAGRHNSAAHTHFFGDLVQTHPPTPPARADWAWDDMIALPYSSGTTGFPKGVMLSQKNLTYNACQQVATARITALDRMLIFLPLYHVYGIMLMGQAAISGATIVLMERFDPITSLELVRKHGITLFYAVPQVLAVLNELPQLHDYNLSTIRYVQCGAAPVPPPLARCFEELTNVTVMTSYGLTEASPCSHSNPVYDRKLIKVETIGLPIHGTKQKIVDVETGQIELGVGEEGELVIQGPQVMLGYWKAPEATAEAIRDGWLHTGDIGWRDEEGYVTITDRKKELIKYKGFSVAPAQIEALLLEHPAVADAAVVAKQDKEAGEIPKAFVVLRAGYESVTPEELITWANGKLATYKNVREVEFIDAIPRNPSGKILRRVLKEQERQRAIK